MTPDPIEPTTAGPEAWPSRPGGPQAGWRSGTRLWLVRHAEVELAAQGRAYGSDDVPLAPEGELRSDELALSLAQLRPNAVLASPLYRALRLGQATAQASGVELEVDAALAEIDRGAWQALQVADLHRRHADQIERFRQDPWSFKEHGGESDRDVVQRAWPLLERVVAKHSGGTVVFCSHYNVIRCLSAFALGIRPERSFALRLDKARALLLEDAPRGLRLCALNIEDPGAFELTDEHLGARS